MRVNTPRAILLIAALMPALAQDRVVSSDAVVRAIAFSRDGRALAGICDDGRMRQWDVLSGALRKSSAWSSDESPVSMQSVAGAFIAMSSDGTIALHDFESGATTRRARGPDRRIPRVALSGDGMVAGSIRVAGNGREELMRLWDSSGKERFAVPGGIGGTSALAISPDGSVLVAAAWDTDIRIWTTRNGELVRHIEDIPVSMFDLAFTPDGKFLAAAGVDRIVYLWDTKTWKLAHKLIGQPEMISAIAFSPDGRLLAAGGFNDIASTHPVSILLWDVAARKVVRTLPAPHRVSAVVFSPDGKLLASTAADKNVRLWKVRD